MRSSNVTTTIDPANAPKLIAAWLFVGIPLLWGVFDTLGKAVKLFQ